MSRRVYVADLSAGLSEAHAAYRKITSRHEQLLDLLREWEDEG